MLGSESQSNIARHPIDTYNTFAAMRLKPEELELGIYENPYYLMMAAKTHENGEAAAMTGVNVEDIRHSLGRTTLYVHFLDPRGRAWIHGLPGQIDNQGFWKPLTELTIRRQDPNLKPDKVHSGYLLPYDDPTHTMRTAQA